MASGDTKTEAMLNILGNGGSAAAYRGCCNTKTQSYVLDAIDRVQGLEDEVNELKNNPDVADIVATYADLEEYDTSKLTNNAIVRVLADEEHDGASTYYRYNTTTQEFTYIGEVGPYYTEDEIDTLLAGKQDTLTAGSNITIDANNTISAVDTTYTAGTNVSISDQNVISATDTTYSNFTGTDGTAAGAAGLVPAPATTDAGKFLNADGTWATVGGGGGEDSVNSLFLNKGSGSYQYLIPADSNEEKQLCKIINDYISGANKNFLISFAKDSSDVTHTSVSIQNVVVSSGNVGIIFIVTSNNLSGSGNRQYGITYKNLNYFSLTVYVSREEYDANNIQHVFSNSGLTGRTFTLYSSSGANAWAIEESSLSNGPLGTTNTSSYTPTQDYHPATKKYVDTAVASVAANTINSQDWSDLWQ